MRAPRWSAGGRTRVCGSRCAMSGRCWTPGRCSLAGPRAAICCGWPTRRALTPGGWTRGPGGPAWRAVAGAGGGRVLDTAAATVRATGPGTLTVTGLAAGHVAALLGEHAVPLTEISEHRATLEEAYMGLTQDVVEYRAEPAGNLEEAAAQAGTGEAGR